MWILPTRNRPHRLQKFMDSCAVTGFSSEGLIAVDGRDGGDYSKVSLAPGWRLEILPERLDVCGVVDHCYRGNLGKAFYGILAELPVLMG